jgi:hypothetical protein
MLPEGQYSAWYKTTSAGGVGVIELKDGRLYGRDMTIEYTGSYKQDGNVFQAKISTRRHSPGEPAMLGIDELDVEFEGTSAETTAICTGRVLQLPGVLLEVVLVRIED